MDTDLPDDVDRIMEHLGEWARGYGYLKWNEVAKLKADMTNARVRWIGISSDALAAKCRAVGLSQTEAEDIVTMLEKVQTGRSLVPKWGYKDFQFEPRPAVPPSSSIPEWKSRAW